MNTKYEILNGHTLEVFLTMYLQYITKMLDVCRTLLLLLRWDVGKVRDRFAGMV